MEVIKNIMETLQKYVVAIDTVLHKTPALKMSLTHELILRYGALTNKGNLIKQVLLPIV